MTCLQFLIHINFHIVEFDFHAIEQCVLICCTRCNLVKRIDHLDNAI